MDGIFEWYETSGARQATESFIEAIKAHEKEKE